MTTLAAIFLLFIAAFTFFAGMMFKNESSYRKFLKKYMSFFGINMSEIPSTPIIPDPMKPHVMQARVAGYMFIGLSICILGAALYLLNLSLL